MDQLACEQKKSTWRLQFFFLDLPRPLSQEARSLSTWRLQKGLRRAWSPWAAASVRVAGAILGASRKGCGAPCGSCVCGRRSAWSLQKGGAPGRRGRGFCLCGRRSTWSLQKGLRRALWPWTAAPVRVAGAILGASRKGCGAPGRRGPRLLSVWQAQYLEPLERVAARLAALVCVAGAALGASRKVARLVAGAAASVCVAGAVLGASRKGCGAPYGRGPRRLSVWQAQYLEPPERVAARLVAVARGCCLCGRRSTWSLQKGLQRA